MANATETTTDVMLSTRQGEPPAAPAADAPWDLPGGGKAWVYYASGRPGLQRPVIILDDFHRGETSLTRMWSALEGRGFPLVTAMRARGYDAILVGFKDCAASIFDNQQIAMNAIMRALVELQGGSPLNVGGIGAGGLIARYALAEMEFRRLDHQTALYFSLDTPHLGAWLAPAAQAQAHGSAEPSAQINSPAARQILYRHVETATAAPAEDPARTSMLQAFSRVGDRPMRPRMIGMSNGAGDGTGNGLAETDGAPGSTLDLSGLTADGAARQACFVPTASALFIRDAWNDLGAKLDAKVKASALDELVWSRSNGAHGMVTEELGSWLLDRLVR